MSTKTDGPKLGSATQAHLRKLAVQAVRGAMTQTDAAATYGVSVRAVSKWMRLWRQGGVQALRLGQRGRRPGRGRLNARQMRRIRALIVGKMPDQLKLPFYLWTRQAAAELIEREYGITVSKTTVARYLKAWGMSAQKPVRRAWERNDAAIAQWLRSNTRHWPSRPGARRPASSGAMRWACAATTSAAPALPRSGKPR
jgi:transposase